jgi:hypothetical protein
MKTKLSLKNNLQTLASEMDINFSGLIVGRLPSIVKRCLDLGILDEEAVLCKEKEMEDLYQGGSGAVSLFHFFNSKLPSNEQIKFHCSSPIVDSFVSFTEESLSHLFPKINQ